MTSVLLVAPMPLGRWRTGPAIRYWEFACALSRRTDSGGRTHSGGRHQVTLLVPNDDHPTHPDFAVRTCAEGDLDALLAVHQVVVVQGPAIQEHPRLVQNLRAGDHYLVVDLYDPITLEQLEIDPKGPVGRRLHLEYTALLREQLEMGDFFLCATERQRDYWLGALAALGRVNHDTYDGAELRRLIDVVPFGLPAEQPHANGPVLKGVLPGIKPGDLVILWGGGLWDWLDPLSPIRAMQLLKARHPSARLVFFESDRHQPPMLGAAKELAAELGLLGHHVLFGHWQPPERWGSCLLEADVGLSFHHANIETHFAFRTRLLDYIWAGLPIIAAKGDVLSDLVATHDLGYVVEPGDVEALARALVALLAEPDARSRRCQAFLQLSERFRWQRVTEPLLRYCQQPWHAGDHGASFTNRWQASRKDHLLARAAHAERELAQTEAQAAQHATHLHAQIDDLTHQLHQSKVHLEAAMSGRVMRWMTGLQRVLRGDAPRGGE